MQIRTVNRPSISLKGPVTVPQKEQCGPTPHPSMFVAAVEQRLVIVLATAEAALDKQPW
jgi:hypothetical protein